MLQLVSKKQLTSTETCIKSKQVLFCLCFSHELQTCDWPRNVGCGGESVEGATVSTVRVTDPRTRQTPPTQSYSSRTTASQRQPIQREELSVQKVNKILYLLIILSKLYI